MYTIIIVVFHITIRILHMSLNMTLRFECCFTIAVAITIVVRVGHVV